MYINLNEILTQNQLAISEVTHKLIYMLKQFYQCETLLTFVLQQF